MKKSIELYGRLGDAGFGPTLRLDLPEKATAAAALTLLKRRFGPRAGLLKGSSLATDSEVLGPNDTIPKRGRLCLLPPVNGG
jgi:hypothetical protein